MKVKQLKEWLADKPDDCEIEIEGGGLVGQPMNEDALTYRPYDALGKFSGSKASITISSYD